ncbi:MoaD/ThiS family protein [Marinomonas algicola]|jgi:sulfur-carrier protein|uniref:MoaD/ThiS family protein n=1 Tax=Marinomonas algicola TaxID=2773454 RepID=UPI00174B8FBB|nr:MoaD/ThiS family protein [Marinomonas algicola]
MSQVKVVFFASLKESLGVSDAVIDLQGPTSIEEIKQKLNASLENPDPLFEEGIQCSIDYEFARDSSKVDPETVREIAFFPPVTGG